MDGGDFARSYVDILNLALSGMFLRGPQRWGGMVSASLGASACFWLL